MAAASAAAAAPLCGIYSWLAEPSQRFAEDAADKHHLLIGRTQTQHRLVGSPLSGVRSHVGTDNSEHRPKPRLWIFPDSSTLQYHETNYETTTERRKL